MNKQLQIYTCREHVDIGIDDFVNSNYKAPDVELIKDKICDYCNKEAVYKIHIKTTN